MAGKFCVSLTCGKDNRTLCLSPTTGAVTCELPSSANWNFDVQWSPKIPAVLSTASFDGNVNICSASLSSAGGASSDAPWYCSPCLAALAQGADRKCPRQLRQRDGRPRGSAGGAPCPNAGVARFRLGGGGQPEVGRQVVGVEALTAPA